MAFCLIPKIADEFKAKLISGEIDPEKLNNMTSKERHNFFASFMGEENAFNTNALFESKLLLKNQQQGLISWAKQVTGIKPEVQKDLISKINKLDRVLTPEDADSFLEDLAAKKIGVGVTVEEASKIAAMAKKVSEAKDAIQNGGDRSVYGKALVEFQNYISDLKNEAAKTTLEDFKKEPVKTIGKGLVESAGLAKSLTASLDNSAIGRQGLKILATHPEIWARNSLKSFQDIARTIGGKEIVDEVKSDIYSRDNALNGLYKKEKLAVGIGQEEAFPTNIQGKIPFLGKLFKASDAAYTAFSLRNRADIFDKLVDIAKESGGDIKGLGKLVNSLTGRGDIGPLERSSKALNNIFFSPRYLKSNIDILTGHALDKDMSPFARKQAAVNTLKAISAIASILTIAKAVSPKSVEEDPRSSDFGKIKVGNTRFDVSGGLSSLVTLASRLATRSTKSSVTGKVKELNSDGFGSKTSGDVVMDFFNNKLSPAASLVRDLLNGKDRTGAPMTLERTVKNTFLPLLIKNFEEISKDPESANILATMLADALGISTDTYSKDSYKKQKKEIKRLERER